MSLDNIKDITTTARDNLVNAIRTKGVSIADDSTINQCANAVLMITGGGESMKFYKCASVDTTNKTWTGHALVYNEAGYYELSDVITENLIYSRMTPVVDSIYNEDATLRIDQYSKNPDLIPEEGLVFYASLNGKTPTVAETGQVLTEVYHDANNYNLTYMTEDGIPCLSIADADGTNSRTWSGLTFPNTGMPDGVKPRTISIWVKLYKNNHSTPFFVYGQKNRGNAFNLQYYPNYSTFLVDGHYAGFYTAEKDIDPTVWHHIAITFDNPDPSQAGFYIDGKKMTTVPDGSQTMNTVLQSNISIGGGSLQGRFDGWLSSIRVYDRVLGEDEIQKLANEFKSTTEDIPDTPPGDEVVDAPYGYRLKFTDTACSPVWLHEFVQDDINALGMARTWTSTDGSYRLYFDDSIGWWYIDGSKYVASIMNESDMPWDCYVWFDPGTESDVEMTVTVIE